jgi:hypothetical protein
MSIADHFFGPKRKKGVKPPPPPELELSGLRLWFTQGVARYAGKAIEPALVRAQLADHCRDAGLAPLLPEDFAERAHGLDAEAWRRLALAVYALDLPEVRSALKTVAGPSRLGEVLDSAFFGLARELPLLTLDLLQQSPLRIEEITRQFVARLGAAVQGETEMQSQQRLIRLDYARLLEQAERAKVSAEERVEYLRKLQEEQERSRPRRGKW